MHIDQIRRANLDKLPIISGLEVKSLMMGSSLNSSVLERGLGFLKIFNKFAFQSRKEEKENFFQYQNTLTDMNSKKIHIDVSDPLNLKISWPLIDSGLRKNTPKDFQNLAFTIQMGSRNFDQRLRTFQNIFPIISSQHPELKSIDLRYKNKIMLIP